MTSDVLRVERRGPAAVVTLHRPESRNAITVDMKRALVGAFDDAAADPEVAGIVITGADPAFCAGLDLHELVEHGDELLDRSLVDRMTSFSKLLLGAVNGAAVTGGLEIALACDFLVASDRASFRDTHALVGLVPSWGMCVALPRAVGLRWARRMSGTAERIDAVTAARIGLVTEVVPHDHLLDTCVGAVERAAEGDAATSRELFRLYRALEGIAPADAMEAELEAHQSWRAGVTAKQLTMRRRSLLGR